MAKARKRQRRARGRREKTVDETLYLSGRRRGVILKQEVWCEAGEVEEIDYPGYEAVLLRFRRDVEELWRQEDEGL